MSDPNPSRPARVRFRADDRMGLWDKGDVAEDLGWESSTIKGPRIRVLRLRGDLICLTDPFERGLIEAVEEER